MITDFGSPESTANNYYTEYFDTYQGMKVSIMLQYPTTTYAVWSNIEALQKVIGYTNYTLTQESMRKLNKMMYELERIGMALGNNKDTLFQLPLKPNDYINPLILLL